MKILIIIPGFSGGGAERQCIYLADALINLNIKVTVCYFYEGDYRFLLEDSKFKKIKLDTSSFYSPVNILKLIRVVAKENHNIIFSWLPATDIYSSFIKIILPKKINWIVAERNSVYEDKFRDRLRNWLISKFANAIIANSIEGKRFWIRKSFKDVITIPNIVKKPNESPKLSTPFNNFILYVGRFENQKNIMLIYEIFKFLAMNYNINSIMIGEGSHYSEIYDLNNKNPICQRMIHILKFQKNIGSFYNKAELFISLSKFEGMPNTVIENILYDNKMILSDIEEHRAIVGKDYPFLISPEKSIKEISQLVFECKNTEFNPHYYKTAKETLAKHDCISIGKQYISFFEKY